jgi:hypothetical protein
VRPAPIELLSGIKQIITNALLPELQTEQARQQALFTTVLLDHLAARWENEVPLLLEERSELVVLMRRALAAVGDTSELGQRLRQALPEQPDRELGPGALDRENERMRMLLPELARSEAVRNPDSSDLDTALRSYVRRQHRRDQEIVRIGGLSW